MIAPTHSFKLWIAGDYATAVTATREWCADRGDCYAISACDFVYTGGAESGVCITRINYGRFPAEKDDLFEHVVKYGHFMASKLFQKSFSIEGPDYTEYFQVDNPVYTTNP
jgi:hypothetical protein